jgi:ABC-type nitrate/sulfonate/bicarbonate transport system substrate-binding protein
MSADPTPRLRVCTFRGLQNLPLYVAAREGLFAAAGLDVEVLYTPGSAAQVAGLARGEYDLIQTAPDNVIHADHDPAAFGLDPAAAPSIAMVLGGSVGPLSLFARPAVAAADGLRGAVVGVDNPGSGFALVLRDMLARAGLALGRDYTFAVAGGTSARLDALRGGAVAATILYPPYDALAEAAGFRRLAGSPQLYPAYASLATAATRAWIAAQADALTRYLAAVLRALRRIHDPARAEAVRALLRAEPALALDPATAARAYDAFVAPGTGFGAEARLDEAGLRQVIALRAAYAPPARPLEPPAAYCDPRWYARALAAL